MDKAKLRALVSVLTISAVLAAVLYLPTLKPVKPEGVAGKHRGMPGMADGAPLVGGGMNGAQGAGSRLPQTIGGLPLAGPVVTGDQAMAMLNDLHGTTISVKDAYMATYGGGTRQVLLWLSRLPSDVEAQALLTAMNDKMPHSHAFTDHREIKMGEQVYHYVRGMGMDNYYFREKNLVVWVGVQGVDPIAVLSEVTGGLLPLAKG